MSSSFHFQVRDSLMDIVRTQATMKNQIGPVIRPHRVESLRLRTIYLTSRKMMAPKPAAIAGAMTRPPQIAAMPFPPFQPQLGASNPPTATEKGGVSAQVWPNPALSKLTSHTQDCRYNGVRGGDGPGHVCGECEPNCEIPECQCQFSSNS